MFLFIPVGLCERDRSGSRLRAVLLGRTHSRERILSTDATYRFRRFSRLELAADKPKHQPKNEGGNPQWPKGVQVLILRVSAAKVRPH